MNIVRKKPGCLLFSSHHCFFPSHQAAYQIDHAAFHRQVPLSEHVFELKKSAFFSSSSMISPLNNLHCHHFCCLLHLCHSNPDLCNLQWIRSWCGIWPLSDLKLSTSWRFQLLNSQCRFLKEADIDQYKGNCD